MGGKAKDTGPGASEYGPRSLEEEVIRFAIHAKSQNHDHYDHRLRLTDTLNWSGRQARSYPSSSSPASAGLFLGRPMVSAVRS